MRYTMILVVLCAIAMVTLASRANKKRQMKKFMKGERRKQAECDIISWSDCTDGKITQTATSNTSNPECPDGLVDSESATMDCVTNTTKVLGRGCKMTSVYNFTTCQNNGQNFTIVKTFDCRDKVELVKPCTINFAAKTKKMGKMNKKKTNKMAMKMNKMKKKAFRKDLREAKSKGCKYAPAACISNEQKYVLKPDNQGQDCKPELVRPCFAGKMKRPKKSKKGKKNKNLKRRGQRGACKYKNEPWSECDPITNMKTKQRVLKRGDPLSCNETMIVEKPCKRTSRQLRKSKCKYKKTQWSDCDPLTNEKTMVKTLKRGKTDQCAPTQVDKKVCKRKFKNSKKTQCAYKGVTKWSHCDVQTNTRMRREVLKRGKAKFCDATRVATKPCKKKRRKTKKACQYDKSQWGSCDAATNTVTRTLTLKSGDPSTCNATKTITKKCKNKHLRPHLCVYRRTNWGACDPATNMVSMQKTLKRGDPSKCDATKTVQRKCKRKKNVDACKYGKAQWGACEEASNTMTSIQPLISGPSTCPSTQIYSRKCKKPCKFSPGVWSECDLETLQMKREDTLSKGKPGVCPPKRTLTKKCGKKIIKCQYDRGNWSECDSSDKPQRTRVQKLISGGVNCEPERITSKTCVKNSGKERCFFGPWSEFDACKNGVQKKRRQVLQGDLDCERKSVKMKSC